MKLSDETRTFIFGMLFFIGMGLIISTISRESAIEVKTGERPSRSTKDWIGYSFGFIFVWIFIFQIFPKKD